MFGLGVVVTLLVLLALVGGYIYLKVRGWI